MISRAWPAALFIAGMIAFFFGGYYLVWRDLPTPAASVPPITTTQGAAQAPNYNHPDDTETRP